MTKKTEPVKPNHTYTAFLVQAYDGDTMVVSVQPFPHKNGYDILMQRKLRLARINCPEMKDPDPAVQAKAKAAHAFTLNRASAGPLVIAIKGSDTYERDVAEVYYLEMGVQKNLSDELLAAGLAVPYGGKP